MTRRTRIIRNGALSLGALAFLLFVAGVLIVRTDWFRQYVRHQIITATEEGTGGKVDLGSFAFEWQRLRAEVSDFVIHGNEPVGAEPFVKVKRVELRIRFFTSIKHLLDVAYLGVEQPRVNVLVFPDGRTNVPTPKVRKTSDKTVLDTLVDLAVDHFELADGLIRFNSQTRPINVRGDHLRARLWFNPLTQGYTGNLQLDPFYVVAGKQNPVKLTLSLPVALNRGRIELQNAKVLSAQSEMLINGSIEDLRDPRIEAHLKGQLTLADLKALGDLPIDSAVRDLSESISLDANATVSGDAIKVTALNVRFGGSTVQASGVLKDTKGSGALQFTSNLSLDELGRMAKLAQRPRGSLVLNGTARLDAANSYRVVGNLEAKRVSFVQGAQEYRDINVKSAIHFDPNRLEFSHLHLRALGGEFAGDAALEEFARYRVKGNLRSFDIRNTARAFGQQHLPYDGVVSGAVEALGDLKLKGARSVIAQARLTVQPGRRGVPVSGRLNAEYRGAGDEIQIKDSYLALPRTRMDLSGSLGKQVHLSLTSRDLNDLLAVIPAQSRPQIELNGGEASVKGHVTGILSAPRIAAHVAVSRFSVERRQFDALSADIAASRSGAAVSSASLTRGAMHAQFKASAGLANWRPTPSQLLSADVSMTDGDLADVMALVGKPGSDYSGALTAEAHVTGTIGNPIGTADAQAVNGTIQGEPFDRVNLRVEMKDQLITLPSAEISSGQAHIRAWAEFQHPRDSFTSGQVHARVQAANLNLAQLHAVQKQRPGAVGDIKLQAELTGELNRVKAEGPPETGFLLKGVTADLSATGLRLQGRDYGSLTATARTSGQTVTYNIVSDFAGSNIRVDGATHLVKEYPTDAIVDISNLPIDRVLLATGRRDVSASGLLSAKARLNGTVSNRQGSADLNVTNLVVGNEPIDRVQARVTYLAESIEVAQMDVVSGQSRITLSGRYDHPANNLLEGKLQFRVNSNRIELARIRNLQQRRPGLAGSARMNTSGSVSIQRREPRVLLSDLNASIGVTGIVAQGINLGDLNLNAKTSGGMLDFDLNSNLANATIRGQGNAQLGGDYPVDATFDVQNLAWSRLQPLVARNGTGSQALEVLADAHVTLRGPVRKTDALVGSVQIPRLQMTAQPQPGTRGTTLQFRNQGPISARLDRGEIRIESLHLTGPQTDIQAAGSIPLNTQIFDLKVNANTNLGLLQQVNQEITSSGSIVLAATVRGTTAKPLVNGQLELRNASVNHMSLPNGISNANGLIAFNGNSASIRNLTAESGGGKITLGGFAAFRDTLRFGLRANANRVRVRVQRGVSVVSDASVSLTGSTQSSVASGTVTIQRVVYAPQSDLGSILYRAAPPVQTPSVPSPVLENMKLDIAVRTSPAMAVQAANAENLQADADLRIRGTAATPGVLGRVNITEGQLVFFSSTYTVNTGSIAFYNPMRIEPILNLSLATQAKGVEVVLTVTGPVDNMKLSYTSDPPLQFQEIVSLLASGKTPTSDPTLLANEPTEPSQSYQQMGESQLVSKALADPVANRLQRVFGVTRLKIDPTFTGGSDLPQARLTLQQQVTTHLTFTYVTALNDPNTQIIRVEWALNPQWSAIASRDQNGTVTLNFFYKKQFR